MDKKSKKWKLSNEGINDEQAFISRTRFLSGYDGRDFLNENVPNVLFTSVSDAIRCLTSAPMSQI